MAVLHRPIHNVHNALSYVGETNILYKTSHLTCYVFCSDYINR